MRIVTVFFFGLSLTACVSTIVTPIDRQITTEPIVIEVPVTAIEVDDMRNAKEPSSLHVTIHEAAPDLKPWQRIDRANKAAKIEPGLEHYRNAVQVYQWADGALYALYAAPGRVSVVSLEPGEELVSVSAGDTANWIVGDTISGSGSDAVVTILIKPVRSGLTTNLVITSTRRTYLLELTSFRETAMAALSWTYPEPVSRNTSTARAGSPGIVLDPASVNFRYVISGDVTDWRPIRAFDDGAKTYLEFPAGFKTSLAPPLYLVSDAGEAELVNYRVKNRFYIVDRLIRIAELKIGTAQQKIVRIERVDSEEVDHE